MSQSNDEIASSPVLRIDDPQDPRIAEVAALDRALFGEQFSLGEATMRRLVQLGGTLFVIQDPRGAVIAEAVLALHPDPDGASVLERRLPAWLAYCDGAAVAPAWRRLGLQQRLLAAREQAAIAAGRTVACASVRQSNLASIRAMLHRGFVIAADAPRYFGPGPEHARIVMAKMLDPALGPTPGDEAHVRPLTADAINEAVAAGRSTIDLLGRQSEAADPELNAAMGVLLAGGYLAGVCLPAGDGHVLRFEPAARIAPQPLVDACGSLRELLVP